MSEKKDEFADIFAAFEEEKKEEKKTVTTEQPASTEVVSIPPPTEPTPESQTTDVDAFLGTTEPSEPIAPTPPLTEVEVIPEITAEEAVTKEREIPPLTPSEEFGVVKEAVDEGAIGYMVYALKGGSKTTVAFSFIHESPDTTIACLSFDRQSVPIKEELFGNNPRIKVYDAIMHWNRSSSESLLESSDKTYRYVNIVLDSLEKERPDYIVLDGSEIFQFICEQTMRSRSSLQPYQGLKNLNLWKLRKMFVDQVFLRSLKIAKKGVICTAYVSVHEVVEPGGLEIKKDVPKWIGAVMTNTRVVIRTRSVMTKNGMKFYATVESSKTKDIKTGITVDITGDDKTGYHCIEKIREASRR